MIDQTASKNAPLRIQDCAEMARIICNIEPACLVAYGVNTASELHWEYGKKSSPWSIPESNRFISGAIKLGFVLGDYETHELVNLDLINRDPQGTVGCMEITDLRWFIHTIQRADKWADGFSSPILECLASGSLQLAGKRLAELVTNSIQINKVAYQGDWENLLLLLREWPELINSASEKGYTPLHQAAWHGASLSVIGQILHMGADKRLRTINKRQTALDIAKEKHRDRPDLVYALNENPLTIAQLMRKVITDKPSLFGDYDGNQLLADRLITAFGSDPCPDDLDDLNKRLESAFIALTGVGLSSQRTINLYPALNFELQADAMFWESRFFPIMKEYASRAHIMPIEKEWAVVADLFDPAPAAWGLRGDLFLWLEMRQVLCHVAIPENLTNLGGIIKAAFQALTGSLLKNNDDTVFVSSLDRGGMSSGGVSGEFWVDQFIPLIENRAEWLHELSV